MHSSPTVHRAQTGRNFGRKVWQAPSLHEELERQPATSSLTARGVAFGGKLI